MTTTTGYWTNLPSEASQVPGWLGAQDPLLRTQLEALAEALIEVSGDPAALRDLGARLFADTDRLTAIKADLHAAAAKSWPGRAGTAYRKKLAEHDRALDTELGYLLRYAAVVSWLPEWLELTRFMVGVWVMLYLREAQQSRPAYLASGPNGAATWVAHMLQELTAISPSILEILDGLEGTLAGAMDTLRADPATAPALLLPAAPMPQLDPGSSPAPQRFPGANPPATSPPGTMPGWPSAPGGKGKVRPFYDPTQPEYSTELAPDQPEPAAAAGRA